MYNLEAGWCFACDKGMKCAKHGVKQKDWLDEGELNRPEFKYRPSKVQQGKLHAVVSPEEAEKLNTASDLEFMKKLEAKK